MKTEDFESIFERLRAILKPLEGEMKLKTDEASVYNLYTRQVRADGYEYAFGTAIIKKNYVSYHLFPVYSHPDLMDGVSEGLKKRMQGKSCFNFKTMDDALFTELEALTLRSAERLKSDPYK
jgi:hypothetical protein